MHLPSRWPLGIILTSCLWAQAAPAPAEVDEVPTFTTEARVVNLPVTVLDRDGKPVTGIPREFFKVFENDVEQVTKTFQREDVPVSMCIIIDSSGSMKDRHSSVVAAALALVRASNPEDEVCFVNFNDLATLEQPFTNEIAKLEQAMDAIDTRGGTAMRNAISAAIDYVKENAKRDKKVLVVVTDGNDNASNETTLEQLVRSVRESEVLVYTIGLLNTEERGEARKARRALDEITEASGGFAYYPESLAEVEKITPRIAHEIRNQYSITYSPQNAELDGTYRRIRVEVRGAGRGLVVRTRSGYYATRAAPAK
jgi:VWFA-related protein